MKAFLTSLIAAAAIAYGAYWLLEQQPGRSTADRYADQASVRLGVTDRPSKDGSLAQ